MSFRTLLFWIHLVAGLVAGLFITLMSFTGAALAFEKELVAWAERDVRRIAVPGEPSARLTVDDLKARLQAAQPGLKQLAVTVHRDPARAVVFTAGRDQAYYADPYTGEIRQPATRRMHSFMHTMTDWHRWLALEGERRPLGKALNGAANLAFVVLCVTGLVLWWPRTWRGLKGVLVPRLRLSGQARDFNWHNILGFWTLPILVVLTVTAVPISYRWASNLVFRLAGEAPPAQPGPGGMQPPPPSLPPSTPGARPLPLEALLARATASAPDWKEVTLRSGGGRRESEPQAPRGPQPVTAMLREAGSWPRTATTTLFLDPFTGEALRTTRFADLSAGRRLRTWTRFLHTGEALGGWGQALAGLASLGALVLVYTGGALTWRRFRRFRNKAQPR